MEKNELPSRLMEIKLNTECGILSDPSWLLPSLEELKTYTSNQEPRCSILVLPLVLVFLTVPILLDLKELCTPLNSLTDLVVI